MRDQQEPVHKDQGAHEKVQDSFVKQHQTEAHPGEAAAYTAKVTGVFSLETACRAKLVRPSK